jgi:hypothetical protein
MVAMMQLSEVTTKQTMVARHTAMYAQNAHGLTGSLLALTNWTRK